jgi:hypothetical protein
MPINNPVALQAATNELREMRAELTPFISDTGPARGMAQRLDRVVALLDKAQQQAVADAAELQQLRRLVAELERELERELCCAR